MTDTAFNFEFATPESLGIPSRAITEMIESFKEQHIEVHSMIISRHKKIAAEFYFAPYSALPHRIYSANKSTNMLQTLFAVQDGCFNIDDRLVDLMPESMPDEISDNLKKMTVRHLLTMMTGHAKDTFGAILNGGDNRAKAFFSEPVVYEPGTHFLYNNGVPDILAILCRKYTGETVDVYMKRKLFDPLKISSFTAYMNGDQPELPTAALSLRDLFKYAVLLADNGKWEGHQLLPAELISEAGKPQVSNSETSVSTGREGRAGYGWQLWRNSVGGYRIDGGKGQFGLVFPEYDMVIAVNSNESLKTDRELNTVYDHILRKSFTYPLSEDPDAYNELQEKIRTISYQLEDTGISGCAVCKGVMDQPVYGRTKFDFSEDGEKIVFAADDKEPAVFSADGNWYACRMPFDIPETQKDVPSNRLPAGVAGADKEAAFVSAVFEARDRLTLMFRSGAWDGGYMFYFDLKDGMKVRTETTTSLQVRTAPDYDENDERSKRLTDLSEIYESR